MDCEHVKRKITKRKEEKKWEKASSLDFYQFELLRFVTAGSGKVGDFSTEGRADGFVTRDFFFLSSL